MIAPEEIAGKAARRYPRFLASWVAGEGDAQFPMNVRANLSPIKGDMARTITEIQRLREGAKERRGWGYTVHWKMVRSREFGHNPFPRKITIDTLEDLLRLAACQDKFKATSDVAGRIRRELPALDPWLVRNVLRLFELVESVDSLIAVTKWFLDNPNPDCYIRQIPLAIDTKFVERHQGTLRAWLDELLPASAIDVNETRFPLRFGLRDGRPHFTVRALDPVLQAELKFPFDELSLPLRHLASLDVAEATVVIVENRTNLLTLPELPRTLAIFGEGQGVTSLTRLQWLNESSIIYWGDIDVWGFKILSTLRSHFPHIRSIMMDLQTLNDHRKFAEHAEDKAPGNGRPRNDPPHLTESERLAFRHCLEHHLKLEQEHIHQSYVDGIVEILNVEGLS